MTNRNGFLIWACLLTSLLWGPHLHADNPGAEVGLMYGLSVPDADNTKPFHVSGVRGISFMNPQISFGGYFMNSDSSGQVDPADVFQYSLTGIEAAYHLPATSGDTYFALRIGMTKVLESPGGSLATFSPYHYGFTTGYDYFLTNYMSVGFEGSYLHVLPGRTLLNGVTYDVDSFNIINFLILLNFRF